MIFIYQQEPDAEAYCKMMYLITIQSRHGILTM